jgi:dienelactone hydrolase
LTRLPEGVIFENVKEEVMVAKTLAFAGLLLTISAAVVPAIAAEDVIIPSVEAGKQLQLPGTLHKPSGGGPFPAVVMLVGCGGYAGGGPNAEHQSSWAEKLVEWGYVALQVDSFSPRGPSLNCDYAGSLTISHDAFSAKSYLSKLPFVDSENIAVVGWSMGGMAVLKIIDRYFRDKAVSPFKAGVAFYPSCYPVYEPDTPLLLMIGKKDEVCRASLAEDLKKKYTDQDWKLEMSLTIYPNAYHSFDMEGLNLEISGHHFQYDPQAAADAIVRLRDFLTKYTGAR